MKFLTFTMFDVSKAAEVAQAGDKAAKTPGQKTIAQYICQGIPFEGVPPNAMVVVHVGEYESNESIAASQYPVALAGATVWAVPVLELAVGRGAAAEKKYRK